MYEPDSHALLARILDEFEPEFRTPDLQTFWVRLGANFHSMHKLYRQLYGERADMEQQLGLLLRVLLRNFRTRDTKLKAVDWQREQAPDWFLSQNWVGMALYCDRFAGGLKGVNQRVDYLRELGVNLLHIMPVMQCPAGANDGGYAVSNFRQVDSRFGSLADVGALAENLHRHDMLLTLDVVINHTSDEHEWVKRARAGEPHWQDYYYLFPDRTLPDRYEQGMPEIFPQTAPGNFTFDPELGQWAMTVFNPYQWDLNYHNPSVLTEMMDIILYWANQGADILRLDAPAFIWKQLGTSGQNLPQAHLILQLFKDCAQIVCPGVLFIAEAIVAPREIVKYFGTDPVEGRECEIAYNATFMALLWDAVSTRNVRLLNQGLRSQPAKPARTTWLNYVRCHDDIGLGFEDADIIAAGYDVAAHRKFLIRYLSGKFPGSTARGLPFGANEKTGDARISGSLASLAGLESALESAETLRIEQALQRILTLHALILSWGGIALLYYGDELALLNDYGYADDPDKAPDNRWVHRPQIDWKAAEARAGTEAVSGRIFNGLRHLIRVRRQIPVFADWNNRILLLNDNQHLFTFYCFDPQGREAPVTVVANFDEQEHFLNLDNLRRQGISLGQLTDLAGGTVLETPEPHLLKVPACGFYWLASD